MSQVEILEVAPRDGFQAVKPFIPTETKIALIEQLAACGFKRLEIGSFVSPKAIPQLADTGEILRRARLPKGLRIQVLVPNAKGLEMATFCRPTEILRQVLGPRPLAVLSGPSHAEEVGRGQPTSLVAAKVDPKPKIDPKVEPKTPVVPKVEPKTPVTPVPPVTPKAEPKGTTPPVTPKVERSP